MTDFQEIPLAKLEPHPANIRKGLHDIDELADSIKSKGIVQALTVAPHPTARTKYLVLGGHRRLAAAKQAKVKLAPCMIRTDLDTAELQTEFMLVENTQRHDLSAMEEALAFQTLLELPGYDAKKIAAGTGRNVRAIRERVKLAKLGSAAVNRLETGQITLEQAMVFAEFADDEAATAKLLKVAGSPYEWEYQVRSFRNAKRIRAALPKTIRALEHAGATIIPRPEGFPYNSAEYAAAPAHLSDAEHIEAGHRAVVDEVSGGQATWAVLRSELAAADQPRELTAEEIAAAEEEQRITAGLAIAAQVRRQHLENVLTDPPAELAEQIITPSVLAALAARSGALVLIGVPETADKKAILDALNKLNIEQLVILKEIASTWDQEAHLEQPHNWGEGLYGYDYTHKWRTALADVYGYQFSDIEREAMDRVQARVDAKKAAAKARRTESTAQDEDDDDA